MAISPDFVDGYVIDLNTKPTVGDRITLKEAEKLQLRDGEALNALPRIAIVEGFNMAPPPPQSLFDDFQGTIVNCRWVGLHPRAE